MRGVKPNLGPIGSAFLVFIGYKKKRQKAKFIYRFFRKYQTTASSKTELLSQLTKVATFE